MLNCRQVTRLVSQSLDVKLPWHRRLSIRVHLLYCVWCRRYAQQVQILRRAAKGLGREPLDGQAPKLSEEAKSQMHHRLIEALKGPPPPPQ